MVLDAAIAPPPLGRVIAGDWIGDTITFGDQHFLISTEFDQHLPNRFGALAEAIFFTSAF
jgi:hypothetical protein